MPVQVTIIAQQIPPGDGLIRWIFSASMILVIAYTILGIADWLNDRSEPRHQQPPSESP